jgi:hypothetical protein
MNLKAIVASRRFLLGSIAAALGFSSVAVPVLLQPAGAAPTEGSNTTDGFSAQAIGTYESCTAYFGLDKSNSNLANFDLVNNTANPELFAANPEFIVDEADFLAEFPDFLADFPLAATDIVPVVTLTDESNNIVECVPMPGWLDEATWVNDYFGGDATSIPEDGFSYPFSYPGTGFWLLPAVGYPLEYFDFASQQDLQFIAVTGTLRFESNLAGVSVLSSMVNLPTTAPFVLFVDDDEIYESSYWASALDLVATAPTGSAEQAALLDSIANGFVNGPTMCGGDESGGLLVFDPNYASLIATLEALIPSDQDVLCGEIDIVSLFLVDAAIQFAKVANAPVTVTFSDSAPASTSTSTSLAPTEPLVPAFTG